MYDQGLDKLCVMDKAKFDQALEQGACDVVDTMLAEGYIPDRNSINTVCINGNLTLLQTLLKYDMNVNSGLFKAIIYGHTHLLNYLYLSGANVNLPNKHGSTVLHCVDDPETCKWLLDMGAQQMLDSNGKTPLQTSCFHRENISIVNLFLSTEQGIQSIALCDNDGYTPLYSACFWGRVETVRCLLSHELGVQSISIPNNMGHTPLHAACHFEYEEVVKLLLSYEQGVQTINLPNNYGNTPLDEAESYPRILALLKNAIS